MAELDADSPDQTLIREYLRGSIEAFRILLVRHQPSILHYASGFLPDGDRARAVARRALSKGFARLPRLRRNSLFSSFLIGILRHELRKEGKKKAGDGVAPLWSGLAGLPRVQREVVFLFFQGTRLGDVARIRHEPPSQTRSRFTNALHHVAKKAYDQPVRGRAEPRCLGQDEIYLWLAEALPPARKRALEEHAAACESCKRRCEAASEFFDTLRRDIKPLTSAPPLVDRMPGPSIVPTVVATAAILLAALVCFLLLRATFREDVTPVRELPGGEVQALELKHDPSSPVESR